MLHGRFTHITQYAYDGFNRLYQTTFPDSTTETVPLSGGYDANGNVLQRISRAGKVFNMTYDVLNRLTQKVVPSYTPPGSSPVLANTIATNYDLGGRLLSTSDSVGNSVTHQYDTAGRPSQTATVIAGLTGTLTTLYQLDANGNRTQLTWPDGYQVNYAYDTSNRMLTATDSASTVLGTYTYDAMSRRTNLAYGNTASLAYAYTDAGDLTSLTNDFVTNSKNVVYTLAYTDAHQLASETISKSTYRYAPGAGTDSYGTINALNQYASMTPAGGTAQAMSYDANGNLTGDGAMNLAYDPENHLVLVSGSASATYAYDTSGRRQTKSAGGNVTNFLSDGDDELAEYTNVGGTGALARRFVPGPAINSPIAYENCTALPCTGTIMVTEYYHTDHHGSVIAMSGSTGNPVSGESNYTYDAYGYNASTSSGGQPFRYVGMYYDAETGLYADRARVYSPYLGRFLQNDPIGYKDDVDLYTYTGDEPVDRVDPSGEATVYHLPDGSVLVVQKYKNSSKFKNSEVSAQGKKLSGTSSSGQKVTTKLEPGGGPDAVTLKTNPKLDDTSPNPAMRSHTDKIGGRNVELAPNAQGPETVAHEVGHVLGGGDQYAGGVDAHGKIITTPPPNSSNSIMRDLNGPADARTIDEILAAPTNTQIYVGPKPNPGGP